MLSMPLRKQGGAVVVTVPPSVLKSLGLKIGSELQMDVLDDALVIMPVPVWAHKRKRYTLAQLLVGATPATIKALNNETAWARAGMSTSSSSPGRVPQRGDVYWIDSNPVAGREIRDRHRFVVVTALEINKLGVSITVPVTSGGAFAQLKALLVPLFAIRPARLIFRRGCWQVLSGTSKLWMRRRLTRLWAAL